MFGRRTRRNPFRMGGINFRQAAWLVGGIVGTALANDRFVFPMLSKYAGSLVGTVGTTQQRAVNGLSTIGTAVAGGVLLHDIDPAGVELAALGGASLGVGRVALSPVGGSISVAVPGLGQTLAPQLQQAQQALGGAQQALATGTAPATSAPVAGAGTFSGF